MLKAAEPFPVPPPAERQRNPGNGAGRGPRAAGSGVTVTVSASPPAAAVKAPGATLYVQFAGAWTTLKRSPAAVIVALRVLSACRGDVELNGGRPLTARACPHRHPGRIGLGGPGAHAAGGADFELPGAACLREAARCLGQRIDALACRLDHLDALFVQHDRAAANRRVGVGGGVELDGAVPLPARARLDGQPLAFGRRCPYALAGSGNGEASGAALSGHLAVAVDRDRAAVDGRWPGGGAGRRRGSAARREDEGQEWEKGRSRESGFSCALRRAAGKVPADSCGLKIPAITAGVGRTEEPRFRPKAWSARFPFAGRAVVSPSSGNAVLHQGNALP